MLRTLDFLQAGSAKQKEAFRAIRKLKIMNDLAAYNPTLCGTFPLNIAVDTSDLDIIMEVYNLGAFEIEVRNLYSRHRHFHLKKLEIRGNPVVKANFTFEGFEFELFGQPQPIEKQYAYMHMIVEDHLLKQFPGLRDDIIRLKKQGIKTEPAFCKVLGLRGDPYESLIHYGREQGMIP